MVEQKDSGRRNTGRTDKYSDESPKKDYQDYRKDYPKENETARKISKDITNGIIKPRFIGPKSVQVRRQELIAHLNQYQETFNSVEDNEWLSKANDLLNKLRGR
ncbi:MAG TPA: hypothetical protein VLE21_04775 [Candidatus Nitrosocosmicus sp.]|nr:hypothetical protein [Candidatus Nitrosocosmicus sp.]